MTFLKNSSTNLESLLQRIMSDMDVYSCLYIYICIYIHVYGSVYFVSVETLNKSGPEEKGPRLINEFINSLINQQIN